MLATGKLIDVVLVLLVVGWTTFAILSLDAISAGVQASGVAFVMCLGIFKLVDILEED